MALDNWLTPTNPEAASTIDNYISHAGDYWFSVGRTGATVYVRYSTDAAGPWGTATLPAAPTGYTFDTQLGSNQGRMVYGGGQYAFLLRYINSSNVERQRVLYATDPAGTWTQYEFDSSNTYSAYVLYYADSKFILAGTDTSSSPNPAFIAYSSTANGTYTFGSGSTATGYDTSVDTIIQGIAYNGTYWLTTASRTGTDKARYSTSLTSGWAATAQTFGSNIRRGPIAHSNGLFTISTGALDLYYTDDPGNTWPSRVTSTEHGLDDFVGGHAYGNGYWVVVGSDYTTRSKPRIMYLQNSTPMGTYTQAVSNMSEGGTFDAYWADGVAYYGGYFVAGNTYLGQLRYAQAPNRAMLRRRQSPAWAPSRVRPTDLRQRQTPYIT